MPKLIDQGRGSDRDPAPSAASVHWESVLHPHRSLPGAGFRAVMLVLGLVSLGSSIFFIHIGAWPICGFFGLDVLGLYIAFRVSYRGARMRETLRLIGDDFTVERVGIRGDRRFWRFQAFWLRVRLVEKSDASNRLLVESHGHSLPVAVFLSPGERRTLADDLSQALRRWKAVPV